MARFKISGQSGNVALFLAITLGALFAVGGFAIDTTLFMLKRQEVQSLADDVAIAAALSLPDRDAAEKAAESWFEVLRFDNGRPIADSDDIVITTNDNSASTSNTVPYSVESITVTISIVFTPEIFPIGDVTPESFTIVGSATARLKPTDVLLIIENSSSFYKGSDTFTADGLDVKSFFADWDGQQELTETCFGNPWRHFKAGALKLYDTLSELDSHRVAVMLGTSRAGSPLLLRDFGQTTLTSDELEYQADQDAFPSTRCAAMTSDGNFAVPAPPVNSAYWSPRTDLSSLLKDPSINDYSMGSGTPLTTREAIWMLSAGYPNTSGYIPMQSYYLPPADVLMSAAIAHIKDSRRSDNTPVNRRAIIFLTDDAGAVWSTNGVPSAGGAKKLCEYPEDYGDMTDIDYINVYYGHNFQLPFHAVDDPDVVSMRTSCVTSATRGGELFVEYSDKSGTWSDGDFESKVIPLLAQGLKEAELIR